MEFLSTPPCGGDFGKAHDPVARATFLSTPPCGGDRPYDDRCAALLSFYPRLRAEATRVVVAIMWPSPWFLSTPPCGGDSASCSMWTPANRFYPRLRAEATSGRLEISITSTFLSTPPCGGDQLHDYASTIVHTFLSTPPCGGDFGRVRVKPDGRVSIHASVRRRPRQHQHGVRAAGVSIHASVRRRRAIHAALSWM